MLLPNRMERGVVYCWHVQTANVLHHGCPQPYWADSSDEELIHAPQHYCIRISIGLANNLTVISLYRDIGRKTVSVIHDNFCLLFFLV